MDIQIGDKVYFKSWLSDRDCGDFRGWASNGKAVLLCDYMHIELDKSEIIEVKKK